MTDIVSIRGVRANQFVIDYLCDYCGKEAADRKSHYDRKTKHFCSTDCYSNYRKYDMPKWEHNRYGTGFSAEEQAKRRKARSDLNHAIRSGKVTRPTFCEIESCVHEPEAHHPDYDKPLEVRWLCFTHHRAHHKAIYENSELMYE